MMSISGLTIGYSSIRLIFRVTVPKMVSKSMEYFEGSFLSSNKDERLYKINLNAF